MEDNVEDCPVCLTIFDDTLRRPRTLPCGHTLCTPCINELEELCTVTCPTCRMSHALPEAGQFPVSYITEGLIRKMKAARLTSVAHDLGKQLTATAPVAQPAPRDTAGLNRKTLSLLQEKEAKVLAAIRSCQEEQSQLTDYRTTLGGWKGHQQLLEDELQTLVDQSKGARETISSEENRVEDRKEEVRQREEALHAMMQALCAPSTDQEAYQVMQDADHLLEEEEEEEERAAVFPDVHVVTTVARVVQASRLALQATAAAEETTLEAAGTSVAAGDFSLPAATAAASSIMDRLPAVLAPPLTAEELLRLTQRARGLVEAGRVLAVHDVERQTRHSRISLEHGRLHLHSLQDTPPPPHAFTLQIDEVVPAVPPCEVFLDLAWPGFAARRVVVSLPRDTPAGRQFVLLCSGQRGVCYANTRFFDVGSVRRPGEWVEGGFYETNIGKGGAALLPCLDQGHYWNSGKAGAVWRWPSCAPARGALFGITTRDRRPGGDNHINVFGEVVCGLEVVQEAAHHRPITEVTVVQCGVLLPRHTHTILPLSKTQGEKEGEERRQGDTHCIEKERWGTTRRERNHTERENDGEMCQWKGTVV